MPTDALRAVRGFLMDLDGTVYMGERLIEGARAFFDVLRAQGKPWLFLTNNSSKDAAQYVAKLTRLGLPTELSQVLTSGEATAGYLNGVRPGARVYVVGTPALEAEFAARGFVVTDEAPDYAVLGFDTTLTYAKLWRLCDLVRAGPSPTWRTRSCDSPDTPPIRRSARSWCRGSARAAGPAPRGSGASPRAEATRGSRSTCSRPSGRTPSRRTRASASHRGTWRRRVRSRRPSRNRETDAGRLARDSSRSRRSRAEVRAA